MSLAPALVLREGDRERLGDLARLPSVPSGVAKRARMVLLAAGGMPNAQIARTVGVSRPTVAVPLPSPIAPATDLGVDPWISASGVSRRSSPSAK
jgi:DNA-binding CsgD family transcriptional regulator